MIGLVGHTYVILRDAAKIEGMALAAVASDDAPALEKFRASPTAPKGTKYYTDYRDMLEAEELDIVGVCNADGARAEAIIAAAEAGCDIITEKPLSRTLEELDRVRESIARAGVGMTMLLTMRCEPLYMAARKLMEQGVIGEVAQMTAQKSYRLGSRPEWVKSRRTFSGVIPFVGVHMVDLMRWIGRREFVEAAAYGSNVTRPEIGEMEDNASALFKMDNGGSATLRIDFLRPQSASTHGDDRLRLAGANGVLEIRGAEGMISVITPDRGMWTPELPPAEEFFVKFVRSLEGHSEPPVPAEDCCRATEICLLAQQAQDTGRPVSLTRG
jgi:predicted dehydrogenase